MEIEYHKTFMITKTAGNKCNFNKTELKLEKEFIKEEILLSIKYLKRLPNIKLLQFFKFNKGRL